MDLANYLELWLAHVRERVRGTIYEGYESLLRCHVSAAMLALPLTKIDPF